MLNYRHKIAMDLYSRCITGLRLSPASTKSVDAALLLFEALRPGSRQHTSGGLLPYAGLPDPLWARTDAAYGFPDGPGLPETSSNRQKS